MNAIYWGFICCLLTHLSLRENIIIEDVLDFAIGRDLLRLQPEANSTLLQQLHGQLWLQGDN